MSGDEVVELTDDEREAVSLWLAVGRLEFPGEWLEWEEVAMLSEAGHAALLEAVDNVGEYLNERLTEFQRETGVDAGAAYWRAVGLPNPAASPEVAS